MQLDREMLQKIAHGKPGVPDWPNDVGDEESLARYQPFIDDLKSLPVSIRHDDGWNYGDTFFELYLHHAQTGDSYRDVGLYVALCRFAPNGIYGEESRSWDSRGGSRGFPSLDNAFCVSNSNWRAIAEVVREKLVSHSILIPTLDELSQPMDFPLPKMFLESANRGKTLNFHILFNDLY